MFLISECSQGNKAVLNKWKSTCLAGCVWLASTFVGPLVGSLLKGTLWRWLDLRNDILWCELRADTGTPRGFLRPVPHRSWVSSGLDLLPRAMHSPSTGLGRYWLTRGWPGQGSGQCTPSPPHPHPQQAGIALWNTCVHPTATWVQCPLPLSFTRYDSFISALCYSAVFNKILSSLFNSLIVWIVMYLKSRLILCLIH